MIVLLPFLICGAALRGTQTLPTPLEHQAIVGAPVGDVWRAYTTTEGLKSWMVAEGSINLKIGGLMKTAYKRGTTLDGPDAIVNKILSLDPERMITIQCVHPPAKFPYKSATEKLWTVIYFEPVGESQTRVTCRMLGFDASAESEKVRGFFQTGNQQELDALVKHFEKG